jgi:hypothetical protein
MQQDPRLRRLLAGLPRPVGKAFDWLLQPRARWVRLPLGAILIGQDVPPLRRLTLGGLGRVQSWLDRRRARRRA